MLQELQELQATNDKMTSTRFEVNNINRTRGHGTCHFSCVCYSQFFKMVLPRKSAFSRAAATHSFAQHMVGLRMKMSNLNRRLMFEWRR